MLRPLQHSTYVHVLFLHLNRRVAEFLLREVQFYRAELCEPKCPCLYSIPFSIYQSPMKFHERCLDMIVHFPVHFPVPRYCLHSNTTTRCMYTSQKHKKRKVWSDGAVRCCPRRQRVSLYRWSEVLGVTDKLLGEIYLSVLEYQAFITRGEPELEMES